MKPVSPVIPGHTLPEIVFAKDQPEYQPLPAFRDHDGYVLTRWRMTWRERLRVLFTGDIYLSLLTFGRPLQPVLLFTEKPKVQMPGAPAKTSQAKA